MNNNLKYEGNEKLEQKHNTTKLSNIYCILLTILHWFLLSIYDSDSEYEYLY
jgi:hypothetical protein